MNWRVSGSIALGALLFSAAPALQAFSQSSAWSDKRPSLAAAGQVPVLAANAVVGPPVPAAAGLPSTAAELWPELSPLEVANRIRFGQDYVTMSQAALARTEVAPTQVAATPGTPPAAEPAETSSEVASLPVSEQAAPRQGGKVRVVGPQELAVGINPPSRPGQLSAPSAPAQAEAAGQSPVAPVEPQVAAIGAPAAPDVPAIAAPGTPDTAGGWDTPMVVGSVDPQQPITPGEPQVTAPVPAPAHLRPVESYINKSSRIEQAVIAPPADTPRGVVAPPADIPNASQNNRVVRYDRLEDYCRDPAYLRGEVEYGWCDDPGYFQRRDDLIMGADDYSQEWEPPARLRRMDRDRVEFLGPADVFPFLFGR